MTAIDTWKFLAGLGLFLYGISLMNGITHKMVGRRSKLFLKNKTNNLFTSVTGGAVITGIIESSSVVVLMLISFVDAGIISFQNAFGILIGANLGTTIDSWLLASLGFTFNLQLYALPVIAVCAIGMYFFSNRKSLYNTLAFLFSIAILLFGFSYMKEGTDQLVKVFDPKAWVQYNHLVVVGAGFLLTVLIQSSSATMAIALTALAANVIDFPAAACIIIGSEVGTTIKFLFSSIKSKPAGKMLAWADFGFNIFTAIVAYILLYPISWMIQQVVGERNVFIGLAFFQSFINLLAIVLFIPFIRPFSQWLIRYFTKREAQNGDTVLSPVGKEFINAIRDAASGILQRSINFHNKIFDSPVAARKKGLVPAIRSFVRVHGTTDDEYNTMKEEEGNYLKYFIDFIKKNTHRHLVIAVENYFASIRQSILAAKLVHDIRHDLQLFRTSANNFLYAQEEVIRGDWQLFLQSFNELLAMKDKASIEKSVLQLRTISLQRYGERKKETENAIAANEIENIEASTLLNVYQELFSSQKALLRSLAYLKLDGADGI